MRPDPVLGMAFIPGAVYQQSEEGCSKGKINSHGLREYEYSYEKPDNTYRIIILGDSFTEALQVSLDSTFHQVLERSLKSRNKNYEVIAMGRSGMGTYDELLWYRTEGRNYRPDMVICAFYLGNDFRDNSRELTMRAAASMLRPFLLENGVDTQFVTLRSYRIHSALVPIMRSSRVLTYIKRAIDKIRRGSPVKGAAVEFPLDLNVFRSHYDTAWTKAVRITAKIVSALYDEVKRDSAQFLMVGIPDSYQFYRALPCARYSSIPTDLDFNKPDSLLEAIALSSGIRYIPLSPCFQAAIKTTGLFYYGFGAQRGTGHWNEQGHRLAAGCIEEAIKSYIP